MSWPELVWSAPILRGIDARGRAEIEAAGALTTFARGEVVFRPGQPADSFFVVAEGHLHVRGLRRGEVDLHVVRHARAGDAFGEESSLYAGGTRQMEAACEERSRVAEIPLTVFRRAIERSAGGESAGAGVAARHERTLRRAATSDLLSTMSFTRDLASEDVEILLDVAEHVHLSRGEPLFREGENATHVYFIADGMLQVQTEDDERIRVRAYLTRGDVVGDTEMNLGGPRHESAVASGGASVLAVPRAAIMGDARRYPTLLDRNRRDAEAQEGAQHAALANANTTQHVFKDLYRLQVARSLLVIDESACVRCGHCAWSCASAHDDGVSRLVRRGEKIVARVAESVAVRPTPGHLLAKTPAPSRLLIPSSCQHCENPACMPDCPTGAIGRDPRGEVFIREDLCTGCGNCAKGCPWDNIQMAPRRGMPGLFDSLLAEPREAPAPGAARPGTSDEVAVKCDLCKDLGSGPACVAACPTEAIVRINPSEVLADVRAVLNDKAPIRQMHKPIAAWPWLVGAVPIALALAKNRATSPRDYLVTGAVAGLAVAGLVAYAAVKRWPRRSRTAPRGEVPRTATLRPWFILHLGLGVVATGAVLAHAGFRAPANAAGGLQVALWVAALTGGFGAVVYRALPARLSRIERAGALPEDLRARADALDERAFRALTGRSELVKTIYARILGPYVRAHLGWVFLLLGGASLGQEQRRLRARIDAVLGSRSNLAEKLQGTDELIRLVVERRAVAAQAFLQGALRGWLPLHIAAAAIALVLLGLHVYFALTGG